MKVRACFCFGSLAALALLLLAPAPARAVVQWARRYNMGCGGCHTAYPHLNATGIAFKMNGYRFSREEIGRIDARTLRDYFGPTWSPSVNWSPSSDPSADGRGVRIHIGGPLGRYGAFLAQPITGSAADFNMAQAIFVFGSPRHRFRLTSGRIYPWANGGGIGGADRYITATAPRMIGAMRGVSIGSIGHGLRLEYTRDSRTILALFAADMQDAAARARAWRAFP